jgi:hypothetical protein
VKNSLLHLAWGRWRETWRRREELALALARAWPAGACPLGDGSSEHGGRLRFAGENNEGGRERNDKEGITVKKGEGRIGRRDRPWLDMSGVSSKFCEEVCLGFLKLSWVSRKFLSRDLIPRLC